MSQNLKQTELSLVHAQAAYQKIARRIAQAHRNSETLDELERDLVTEVMRLGRACLEDLIDSSGDGDSGEQMTVGDQVVRRSAQKHRRVYRSVFGNLSIDRYVYRRREKTKALAKPLDQKLGLPADEVSYVLKVQSVDDKVPARNRKLRATGELDAARSFGAQCDGSRR